MADLTETMDWLNGIYRLEETDFAVGGPEGTANLQPKQLAARSQFPAFLTAQCADQAGLANRETVKTRKRRLQEGAGRRQQGRPYCRMS